MANVGIKGSWSLLEFARTHGKMKVTNDFISSIDGKQFKSCSFTNLYKINEDKSRSLALVGFSSKFKGIDLTQEPKAVARQIAAMKDELQVVELANSTPEKPNFKICNVADNWAEVDLGI